MTKKAMGWFVVEKAGRIVDCIRAKDLCLAFQEAMDKWERWCEAGTRIEVKPLPDAPPKPVIVKATKQDLQRYAPKQTERQLNTWPYFAKPSTVASEK